MLHRREFLYYLAWAGAAVASGCNTHQPGPVEQSPSGNAHSANLPSASLTQADVPEFALVSYPEKVPMRLLTDRPPQLETPLEYFKHDLTPNEAFYVRWHLADTPTRVDLQTYRLSVAGHLDRPRDFSLDELRNNFEPVSIVAVNQCSGNQRSLFQPKVPGGQWTNGAVGCARWTGVRLRDLLAACSPQRRAVDVTFQGLDKAPFPSVPGFVKSLAWSHANDGEVLLAYEMNGAPLPMLNGFPLRVVVPGWYATYWVKALSRIEVLDQPFEGYWMKKAYQVPETSGITEAPHALAENTLPIQRLQIHSFLVSHLPGATLERGKPCSFEGLATHAEGVIQRVEISMDGGKNWQDAVLGPEQGRYAWRRWTFSWTPSVAGKIEVSVRASNSAGERQSAQQWNRSGFARNQVETVMLEAV